jgi:hypothetical protein
VGAAVTFTRRLTLLVCLTLLVGAGLVWYERVYDLSLRDASFLTGWLLVGGGGFLALYNSRKKLPFLPLLSSAAWLQLHIYIGLLTVLVFLLHSSFRLPSGGLEIALWCLFVVVAGSGLIGIVISRTLPRRILDHGERVTFERIPWFRTMLAGEVHELAMRSVTESASNTIAGYYANRLFDFFSGPRDLLAHLAGSRGPLNRKLGELRSLRRYLNDGERGLVDEIEARVVLKDNLDHQYALQLLLKGWLFVHIPATYALILVVAVHAVLAYAFAGATL